MRMSEFVDNNLVLKADVDVCLADNFTLDACSYESGDQMVLFSPMTGDVLVCDSATSVFLSFSKKTSLSARPYLRFLYATQIMRKSCYVNSNVWKSSD